MSGLASVSVLGLSRLLGPANVEKGQLSVDPILDMGLLDECFGEWAYVKNLETK